MKKKHIFTYNFFKNKDFFKIKKTNDYLNYLAKFVEQHLSKTHFINTYFCDVTKVENFDKKMFYFIVREPEKSIQTYSLR
jgi:hypothetical protein